MSSQLNKTPRRVYLITYSQRDETSFPTRESFAKVVVDAFNRDGVDMVDHWACCEEPHEVAGYHYHLAIKLKKPRRWPTVRSILQENHGIAVNFSFTHKTYVTAYHYICKSDTAVAHSESHPLLHPIASPSTKAAIKANQGKAVKRSEEKISTTVTTTDNAGNQSTITTEKVVVKEREIKRKKLSNIDLADFCIENQVETYKNLKLLAEERHQNGENDLYLYTYCPLLVQYAKIGLWSII